MVDALGDGDDGVGAALQFLREDGRVVCFFLEDECGEPVLDMSVSWDLGDGSGDQVVVGIRTAQLSLRSQTRPTRSQAPAP